jgi:hypothetical protein
MAYRYWCGECSFKTTWLPQSEGERRQVEHYAARHPGIPPAGQVEINRKSAGGCGGCLTAVAVVVLMFLFASLALHH